MQKSPGGLNARGVRTLDPVDFQIVLTMRSSSLRRHLQSTVPHYQWAEVMLELDRTLSTRSRVPAGPASESFRATLSPHAKGLTWEYARARQVGTDMGRRVSRCIIALQRTLYICWEDNCFIGQLEVSCYSARDLFITQVVLQVRTGRA